MLNYIKYLLLQMCLSVTVLWHNLW